MIKEMAQIISSTNDAFQATLQATTDRIHRLTT